MSLLTHLPDDIYKKESQDHVSAVIHAIGSVYHTVHRLLPAGAGGGGGASWAPGTSRPSLSHPTAAAPTAGPAADNEWAYHRFWYTMVYKSITSTALVTKLFGYEQLNELLFAVKTSRPVASSYRVEHAGTSMINGTYVLNALHLSQQHASSTAAAQAPPESCQYVKIPSEDQHEPVLTLFRCTMRNTKAKWWFLSHADADKPGDALL
jgi:hypothetical protein